VSSVRAISSAPSAPKPAGHELPRLSAALGGLPPYVFAELDRLKQGARSRGGEFTDLGIGSPDRPIPAAIVAEIQRAAADQSTHGYPPFRGVPRFLESVARFMSTRFGVTVEAERETLALAGAKEGIAQLLAACTGPGDVVLVPEIYYPVYARAALLAGAAVHWVPMRAATGFLADFDAVPHDVRRRARLMVVNYPNNPTGTVAGRDYLERAVAFARKHGLILLSDLAYSELTYDGVIAPSALEVPGASEVTIEFHSCSKSFNMAGLRVGFAVGGAKLIDAIAAYRTNVGYGAPSVVQNGAAYALDHSRALTAPVADGYRWRRDAAAEALEAVGWHVPRARGAMYLWLPVPGGVDDWTFVRTVLDEAGVVLTPGSAFGPGGAGYFRVSLVAEPELLRTALTRVGAVCEANGWRQSEESATP
jgi:LL-diaminopimelate aminotransferase